MPVNILSDGVLVGQLGANLGAVLVVLNAAPGKVGGGRWEAGRGRGRGGRKKGQMG